MNTQKIISETRQWLQDIVIGLNFCPFAKKVFDSEAIYYYVDKSETIEDALAELILQCQLLDKDNSIETSLVIYPADSPLKLNAFDDYLDFLELANQLMAVQQYEGVYQLASFHPQYQFENTASNDAENFTNTSPYPMLHLIREQSLEQAVAQYPEPETIPLKNIEVAKQHGAKFFIKYLANLREKHSD